MADGKGTSFDWAFVFLWIMATTWGWILGKFLVEPIGLVASGAALGILQWLVLRHRISESTRWIFATAIGWLVGWGLFLFATPSELAFASGLVVGGCTGIAQWLILRKEVHWAGWWLPISALAWTTGLNVLSGGFLAGATPGALTGIALEILLRYAPKEQSQGERAINHASGQHRDGHGSIKPWENPDN
jgi:hypothetical protein